jgi:hypothetical protein
LAIRSDRKNRPDRTILAGMKKIVLCISALVVVMAAGAGAYM